MRKLRFRDNSEHATFELNLAPMLDMMVTIIPFLLLSAVFLQLSLINVPLPAPVAKALEQDRNKDKRDVSIKVNMLSNKNMLVEVKDESGSVTKTTVASLSGEFDYKQLHKKLAEVKLKHPKVFRLELNPDEKVDYKSIVGAMDASRNMESGDPKVMIEGTATPLMFPDVILANLME